MSNVVTNNINPRSGDTISINGSVSIGGTLTYEDVTNIDSVGIITAQSGVELTGGVLSVPDGSESTPSIQFNGSGTDTGFYSPAADEIAVSTGGSGRLFIDSSGKVGIGSVTSALASQRLTINYDTNSSTFSECQLLRIDGPGTVNEAGGIGFGYRNSSNFGEKPSAFIGNIINSDSGAKSSHLVFATRDLVTDSEPTERMRINSNGFTQIKGPASSTQNLFQVENATIELFYIRNDGLFITGGGANSPYNLTTASAANIFISADKSLRRSTSSIKYKTDVETMEDVYADAILNARPVWYRSTSKGDNAEYSWWGFIAEEIAEIDPRLVHWKTTESVVQEDGSRIEVPCDPEPEGVQYDRFVPHLLNLIKRQKEQIEAQGTAITALEDRLSALEAS